MRDTPKNQDLTFKLPTRCTCLPKNNDPEVDTHLLVQTSCQKIVKKQPARTLGNKTYMSQMQQPKTQRLICPGMHPSCLTFNTKYLTYDCGYV